MKGPSYLGVHLRFGTISIRRARRRGASAHRRGRQARARRRDLALGADLARLLPAGPAPPPHVVGAQLQARVRPRPLRARPPRRRGLRRLVRGPHRLSAGRRGDGADQPDRLDAQPAAHGDGELSDQGPRHRLAPRRGATSRSHLIDYELASNNGGWQWAASTGCDAQPWFRIFNPVTQSRRFDPQGKFIRRYLPQLAGARRRADPRAVASSGRSSSRRPASSSAATIRGRSSTTPRRARRRCSATASSRGR